MKKETVIALLMLIGGLLAVIAPGLADYAKTPAGWTTWDILTGLGIASFIGGCVWLYKLNQASDSEK